MSATLPDKLRFIDSHIHLDFDAFDGMRQPLVAALRQAGLTHLVIPGVSMAHWPKQKQVASEYDCHYALGIHPWYCKDDWQQEVNKLCNLIAQQHQDAKLVALGECGLDGLYKETWEWQLGCFEAQLQLAQQYQLPLIIHSVKAHNEVLALLRRIKPQRGGVVHGFYGSVELAKQYLDLGLKLGIGHLLLNEQAKKLQMLIAQLPLTSFVIETDLSLTQKLNQLQLNRFADDSELILPLLIKKIAELQKKSSVLISEQMFANTQQLFDL
ncbi:TatD family hydrolase [Shewanella sp. AS1]|uniref:TatD family hydrolase n=1 Tax=Shewanella sp. AS1 TaxID=2907626 RepID=UPI001F2B04A7|nr:TatD family hydrolase [Shewanella sp. AS1]MCE9679104.1 TatD family hydrolase [Shewanella sp. AS1]